MVLNQLKTPLEWTELPDRHPGPGQVRVKVLACGVCRTDLHVVDGVLPDPHVPIIPGHQIVGRIDEVGPGVHDLTLNQRVGIPWLGHTCGVCPYCRMHRENLCDHPIFTGFTRDGGFATSTIADARFAFPLGEVGSDVSLAPLLCAGLIGWRSLGLAGDGKKLGLYGYGASSPRSRGGKAGRCLALQGPETPPRKRSPAAWAPPGPVAPMKIHRINWMPRSSSHPTVTWFRWR
jgi:propanol-preferring alcohol dehydrogenase